MVCDSKEALKRLYLAENRRKFPDLPEGARSFPKWTDRNANGLTRMIIDFLRLQGHQAERISVTGRYVDRSRVVTNVLGQSKRIGTGHWIRPSMQPGTADIAAVIGGRPVKIEVKIGSDRQSIAQKAYQEQVENAGGIYIIARTFDEFFNWYQSNEYKPKTLTLHSW